MFGLAGLSVPDRCLRVDPCGGFQVLLGIGLDPRSTISFREKGDAVGPVHVADVGVVVDDDGASR